MQIQGCDKNHDVIRIYVVSTRRLVWSTTFFRQYIQWGRDSLYVHNGEVEMIKGRSLGHLQEILFSDWRLKILEEE